MSPVKLAITLNIVQIPNSDADFNRSVTSERPLQRYKSGNSVLDRSSGLSRKNMLYNGKRNNEIIFNPDFNRSSHL